MGKYNNSHIGKAIGTSPQLTLENQEYENKVESLETNKQISDSINEQFDTNNFSYIDSKGKIENYLLNISNDKGSSKANFFIETLGYSKSNPKELFDNIQEALNGKIPTRIEITIYGEVREFHEKIKSKKGKYEYANIVVVVQRDNGKISYRIITAYPDKKERK